MYEACQTDGCSWALVTAPIIEPLTLAEAKQQARRTDTAEDALITHYIATARQAAEDYLARGLLTQTWQFTCTDFAESIWLPMAAPLQSVTTVKYYDTAGALQTLASTVYAVDLTSRPGRIVRAPAQSWPALQGDRQSWRVEVTYVVGWTAANLIPERILQGVRMFVTYCDYDRDGFKQDGELARQAAESCWTDRVYWKPPAYALT